MSAPATPSPWYGPNHYAHPGAWHHPWAYSDLRGDDRRTLAAYEGRVRATWTPFEAVGKGSERGGVLEITVSGVTVWRAVLTTPDRVPDEARQAFDIARATLYATDAEGRRSTGHERDLCEHVSTRVERSTFAGQATTRTTCRTCGHTSGHTEEVAS